VYVSVNYGHSCTSLLGVSLFFLLFFLYILHEKVKSSNLNLEFCRLYLEFNSSATGLKELFIIGL